jgi:FSR family fosmidomycin resistance protein-like MFS transporter
MTNDTFSNLLSGLLPILTVSFDLSYVLAGLAAMVFSVTSSVMQPLLGRWFDRTQTTWLLEIGLALNCVGMSLSGFSPNYTILLFLLGTAGLGTAAFHPPAFSNVARSSTRTRGESLGVFISGGNAGFFLGPIVAGALVTAFGLRGTIVLLPIGLAASIVLLKTHAIERRSQTKRAPGQPANRHLVGLLLAITGLRSTTIQAIVTFLPLYLVATGESLLLATGVASIWLGTGAVGQIVGGHFSDRVGRRPVIVFSLLTGAALFYGFLTTSGALSMLCLVASGGVLYGSWSVIVATASEAAPSSVGAVAGLMLGFSTGVGGLAALGFALAGGLLAFVLPKRLGSTMDLP